MSNPVSDKPQRQHVACAVLKNVADRNIITSRLFLNVVFNVLKRPRLEKRQVGFPGWFKILRAGSF